MGNPSKKTIKKIDRMLESRCKEKQEFNNGQKQKLYKFRKPTEDGFQYAMLLYREGYFFGSRLDKIGNYEYFAILSPEQIKEICL